MANRERLLANGVERLLLARSVAVIGASRNPEKVGHIALASIVDGGFGGPIYPINPKEPEVLGLPAYPSLASVPGPVDLVVVAVPAPQVPAVLREAAAHGVGGAVVLSGGFREAGHADLEAELAEVVRHSGLRIIGPNCQGFNYLPNRLHASFWFPHVFQGPVAVVSQSGTVAAALAGWAVDEGMGVSATVCLGNQVDLSESDMIDFFGDDPQTRSLALYVEGARDGRRLLDTLRRVAAKKPLVILKSGRTLEGQRAAASHTRSLAGRDEVFDGVCRQFGVIRAPDIDALYDLSKALALIPPPRGRRLRIITTSGGSGILAADEAERQGLVLPPLSGAIIERLRAAAIPPTAVLSNPLDLTVCQAGDYNAALEELGHEDPCDVYLLIFGDPIRGATEVVQRFLARTRASVAVAFIGGGEVEKLERVAMSRAGIPVFPTPERAVRGIAAVVGWGARRIGSEAGTAPAYA